MGLIKITRGIWGLHGFGDEESKGLLQDLLSGKADLIFGKREGETATAETKLENGVRNIYLNTDKKEMTPEELLKMSIVLGHEAHRDGVTGTDDEQVRETYDAATGHTEMAIRMALDGGYSELMGNLLADDAMLEQDIVAYLTGNMESYVDATYDSSGDYHQIVEHNTWSHRDGEQTDYYLRPTTLPYSGSRVVAKILFLIPGATLIPNMQNGLNNLFNLDSTIIYDSDIKESTPGSTASIAWTVAKKLGSVGKGLGAAGDIATEIVNGGFTVRSLFGIGDAIQAAKDDIYLQRFIGDGIVLLGANTEENAYAQTQFIVENVNLYRDKGFEDLGVTPEKWMTLVNNKYPRDPTGTSQGLPYHAYPHPAYTDIYNKLINEGVYDPHIYYNWPY